MSTDIKFSLAQISKIIQSCVSFGSWLGNLGKEALTNIAIPLARDNLPRFSEQFNFSCKWKRSCERRTRVNFIYFE